MKAGDKYQACVDALAAYAKGVGFSQVVIGLSGGIDSSVTAVMAVDAFGAKNVHGVLLPGPYSTGHSIDDALTLAENLGIESHTVSICEPFEAFEQVIRKSYKEKLEGLASENTQARCRMVILMALSNANRWMLVNTGNKSEAAMGYSTLYGDTAGAFAPLGGLYKTDVYEVGRWRNEQARAAGDVEPIPENVFVKPPSAELAPGQKDEASMGIDYETLDKLLIAVQEQGQSVEDACDALGFDIMQATGLLARGPYAFKRAQEPPSRREVLRVRLINGRRTEVCEIFPCAACKGIVFWGWPPGIIGGHPFGGLFSAEGDEHGFRAAVPFVLGADDSVVERLSSWGNQLHGEAKFLAHIAHHEGCLTGVLFDRFDVRASRFRLFNRVRHVGVSHRDNRNLEELACVLRFFQIFNEDMQVIEARFTFAIDLAEHRRNAEGNGLDDLDGMASPGAVSGMELQARAVDFVAMEEQAREGVGGVEEWAGAEDAVVVGHELAPILRVKPSMCTSRG